MCPHDPRTSLLALPGRWFNIVSMPRKANPVPRPSPVLGLKTFESYQLENHPPAWLITGIIEGLLHHMEPFKRDPLRKSVKLLYSTLPPLFANKSDGTPLYIDDERRQVVEWLLKSVRKWGGMPRDHDHEVIKSHAGIVEDYFVHSEPFPIKKARNPAFRQAWLKKHLPGILDSLYEEPCLEGCKRRRVRTADSYSTAIDTLTLSSTTQLLRSVVAYHHNLKLKTVEKILYPKKPDFSEIQRMLNECRSFDDFKRKLKSVMLPPR
mgnify:CR=1 FL=1